jgi:hypothetical protein
VPVEELRRFMAELVQDSNLREAGRLIGKGREAVRKFVSGETETPHDRTREAIARLYVQKYGAGVKRASEVAQATTTTTPLKLILPRGVERATTEVRAIFEALRTHSHAMPPATGALERWIVRRVREEYAAETPYARPRQRKPRRKKDEQAET